MSGDMRVIVGILINCSFAVEEWQGVEVEGGVTSYSYPIRQQAHGVCKIYIRELKTGESDVLEVELALEGMRVW